MSFLDHSRSILNERKVDCAHVAHVDAGDPRAIMFPDQ